MYTKIILVIFVQIFVFLVVNIISHDKIYFVEPIRVKKNKILTVFYSFLIKQIIDVHI